MTPPTWAALHAAGVPRPEGLFLFTPTDAEGQPSGQLQWRRHARGGESVSRWIPDEYAGAACQLAAVKLLAENTLMVSGPHDCDGMIHVDTTDGVSKAIRSEGATLDEALRSACAAIPSIAAALAQGART